jgi:DNA-binding response OmpR family regulator
MTRVLIVDDDINLSRLLRTILRTAGYEVVTAVSGQQALGALEDQTMDLVLLDLSMPVMDGRTVFREMRSRGVETPVLIASAFGARSAQLELGAEGFIEKPFDPEQLLDTVNRCIQDGNTAS